jgi:hypothetical protein
VSLLSRIGRLERHFGIDDSPRRITIWFGPHYRESWIERRRGSNKDSVDFYVKTPDRGVDPHD